MSDHRLATLVTLGARLVVQSGGSARAEQLLRELDATIEGSVLQRARELLSRRGWRCRATRLNGRFANLPTPALLDLGAEFAILRRIAGRFAVIERVDARLEKVSLRQLLQSCRCDALAADWQAPAGRSWSIAAHSLRHETRRCVGALVLGFALAGLGVFPTLLTATMLDSVVPQGATRTLIVLGIALVVSASSSAAVEWWRSQLIVAIEVASRERLARECFARLLRSPWQRISRINAGSALEAMRTAESLGAALPRHGFIIASELPSIAISAGILLWQQGAVALWVAGAVALHWLVRIIGAEQLGRLGLLVTRSSRLADSRLLEALLGTSSVKAGGAQRALLQRWHEAFFGERSAKLRSERARATVELTTSCVLHVAELVVKGYAAWACLQGGLTPGGFVVVVGLVSTCVTGAARVGTSAAELLLLAPSLAAADEVIGSPSPTPAMASGASKSELAVACEDVWFRYEEDGPWTLERKCLAVRTGEIVVLRHASGSGKSTLLRILAGLLAPQRGSVLIFGQPASSGMRHVRYLPQTAGLVEGSIRRNLEILSGASLARIDEAARATGLAAWSDALPMRLETVLAARGANLSGGERQLVLLTALVASTSPIVLLDEPFANMDRKLQSGLSLQRLFPGRTVICVTHEPTVGSSPLACVAP